ncbi:FAD-binding and (Fe-S)-binding domain-containing protein [Paraburkholderia unamae]|uniref:FAD/FMN-containing dehydrogenase n=1 Tax=Paraburkholderia unamae TaxID=219649 RepID=A0ABX5KT17_9BURK|nr:FAD-binding and (Fe-S)-binding domain-containing protein [Paraburkholderia unamae]PVX85929.1 FAD/FMN-containing dehydrogenase [Paraburkholderia unamae]
MKTNLQQAGRNASSAVASAALEADLRAALGAAVRFDVAHRAVYASDASNYRQTPIGVVVPGSMEDVATALSICRRHDAPVLSRGGGTSMSGQSVNAAVVFDYSRSCNRILELDPAARTAIVEPGVVCDTLRDAAEQYGLTFAPDPSTHSRCTLGGMIGNNSCGPHSVMAGKTQENVEALEVMTYDGERFWVGRTSDAELEAIIAAGGRRGQIYGDLKTLRDRYADAIRKRFPAIARRVSGFNLDELLPENGFNVARALVGTEGTCVITTAARVRLVHSPAHRVALVLGFPDIYAAADAVPEFREFGPIAIEGLDRAIVRGLQTRGLRAEEIALLPRGDAWVVLEFGADTAEEATARAQRAADAFGRRRDGPVPSTRLMTEPQMQQRIWLIRETGASATQLSIDPETPDPKVGWEDAAVDPDRLGDYLRAFQKLVDRYGYQTSLFGHFGDGCVHARITFDFSTADGIAQWRRFTREAAELVVRYGGSLSGEHGDGQARAEFLPIMFGEDLMEAMREFKRIWDPRNRMNPGKVVDGYRLDDNLRAGPQYKTVRLHTQMAFRSAEGEGFQRAVERCVGMGRCRSLSGNTMCPSYRATREERYSTRGRSRLLWEMLQGDVVEGQWNSEPVKEALDTCLSCKGCRSDCPAHVDMASYKAEFLSHYYETRRRPRQAWFMGRIGQWAPVAARLPRVVNLLTQTRFLAGVARRVAGTTPSRSLPRFASRPFRKAWAANEGKRDQAGGARKVMLWVDTFSEHFHPEIALDAVEVLRHAGFDVVLPPKVLCCGRPLYDFGYLAAARRHLEAIMTTLAPLFDAQPGYEPPVALVGLEPGCLSVFRDELLKLFPDDARAQRLSSTVKLLGDFLIEHDYEPPRYEARVLVHAHCHQKSIFGTRAERVLLEKMGARFTLLDSGCCGLAGSFGFHPAHSPIADAAGEQVLFPAVRSAQEGTLVLTNGFSCREQIRHGTNREALHLAQLLVRAIHANGSEPKTVSRPVALGDSMEKSYVEP